VSSYIRTLVNASSWGIPLKIPAIEIAPCEPLAGRLPTQAKVSVHAGGRSAATPAGDDFNRQIFIRTQLLSHRVISSEARNLAMLERDFSVQTAHLEMTG
jgi:hypothetical protein